MTWASHMIIGGATAKTFGFNYFLSTFGSILPDLAEMIIPKGVRHRGITHSIGLWVGALVVSFYFPPIRDVIVGVMVGHLLMDSLTPMGVPLLDENSRHITIFGGKIRTASPAEFVISGSIAFLSFFVLPSVTPADGHKRDWKLLYEEGVIDRKEYEQNRFRFF